MSEPRDLPFLITRRGGGPRARGVRCLPVRRRWRRGVAIPLRLPALRGAWALALALAWAPAWSSGLAPPVEGPWLTPGCKIYSTRHWRTPRDQCEVPTRANSGGVIRWFDIAGRVLESSPTPDRHGAYAFWIEGLGNARGVQLEGRALRRPRPGEMAPILRRTIYYLSMLEDEQNQPGLARELRLALLRASIPASQVEVPETVRECEFVFDKTFDPRRNCVLPDGVVGLELGIEFAIVGRVVEAPTAAIHNGLYSFKAQCEGVVLTGVAQRRPRVGDRAVFIVNRSYFPGQLEHAPLHLTEAGRKLVEATTKLPMTECFDRP